VEERDPASGYEFWQMYWTRNSLLLEQKKRPAYGQSLAMVGVGARQSRGCLQDAATGQQYSTATSKSCVRRSVQAIQINVQKFSKQFVDILTRPLALPNFFLLGGVAQLLKDGYITTRDDDFFATCRF